MKVKERFKEAVNQSGDILLLLSIVAMSESVRKV